MGGIHQNESGDERYSFRKMCKLYLPSSTALVQLYEGVEVISYEEGVNSTEVEVVFPSMQYQLL